MQNNVHGNVAGDQSRDSAACMGSNNDKVNLQLLCRGDEAAFGKSGKDHGVAGNSLLPRSVHQLFICLSARKRELATHSS